MHASKPSSSTTYLHLSGDPAMPTARHPLIFASWPTTCPTAPDAAETTTVSPGFGRPISSRPKYAVRPGMPSHESELWIGASAGSILLAPAEPGRSGVNTDHSCHPKLIVSAMSP